VKAAQKPLPQEAEWIALAQKGDKEAYRELVLGYQDRVFNMVISMVRNREQAEDITQEVFVKAFFALPRFKGDSAFFTWLFRIATNTCLDFLRKHKPAEISLDQTITEDEESTRMTNLPAPHAEQPEAKLQSEGDLAKLFNLLKPDQRMILTLREAEGYSYEEIAEMLKCGLNTVKSRINRAREALKLAYEAKYGNILNPKHVEKQ
jgi:RNA polymerase sigma-70 factor (ECF subfamily)